MVSATVYPRWANPRWSFTMLFLQFPSTQLVDHCDAVAEDAWSAKELWAAQREQALMAGLGLVAYVCLRLRFFSYSFYRGWGLLCLALGG